MWSIVATVSGRNLPLRSSLTAVLALLLGLGMSLTRMNAQALEAASQPVPTNSPSISPSASQTAVSTLSATDQQVIDRINTSQTSHGCNFNLTAASAATTAGKCSILIIGDSLGNNLSIGLKYQLKGVKGLTINSRSKASTGLSNSWFYNWPKEFVKMLKQYKPDLVLVMLGANDHQDMKSDGRLLHFGTDAWVAKYSAYMKQITTLSTQSGAYVAWVGLPVMRPPKYAAGMNKLNEIYETVTTHEPGVIFIKTYDYFADSRGKFQAWAKVNGKRSKIRGDDGIHFASAGQPVLGTFVIQELSTTFNVKLAEKSPKRITS